MPTTFGALMDTWLAKYLADKKLGVITGIFALCVLAELLGIDVPGFQLDDNWLLVLFGIGAVGATKSETKTIAAQVIEQKVVTDALVASRPEEPPTFV